MLYLLNNIWVNYIELYKMLIYESVLKLYGLKQLLVKSKKNIDDDGNELKQVTVVIDEDTGQIKENVVKRNKNIFEKKLTRTLINNLYRLFILLILFFECLHPIITSGITHNVAYFTTSFFSYMFIAQYILGIFLYDSEYYDFISHKINNKKYNIYINIAYGVALLISLILATVPLFTTGYMIEFYSAVTNTTGNSSVSNTTYSSVNNNTGGYVVLIIYIIINRLYSYNIFFSNAIIFALLMYVHCEEIKSYKKSLKLMVDDNLMDINISTTIKEYNEIKTNYCDTVHGTNYIFASIIVFGILGCYFTLIYINKGYNNIYSYIDSICALIVQLIYIGAICVITNTVNDIKLLIDSPKFIAIFLNRSNFASVRGDTYDNYTEENIDNKYFNNSPKKSVLKGSISPRKNKDENKNEDKNEDENENEDKDENEIESKSKSTNIKTNSIPVSKSKSQSTINRNSIIIDTIEKMEKCDDKNKTIDFIKNIVFRSMVTSTENGINLDWIILCSKLSDPWERFNVCGFEINDSQLFQQLLSMAFGLLGILEISKLIQ